jgi:hypothetical protein
MTNFLNLDSYYLFGGRVVAVLECPFCSEIVEVQQPDQIHTALTISKLLPKSQYGSVVKKEAKCQNPQCKKPIAVYWYAPMEYFKRI